MEKGAEKKTQGAIEGAEDDLVPSGSMLKNAAKGVAAAAAVGAAAAAARGLAGRGDDDDDQGGNEQ